MVCKRSLKHLQRFFSLETNQEILKSLFPPFSHNLPHLTKYHVIFNFDFNEHHFLNHHFCKLGFQNKLDLNLTLSLILFSFISQKNKKKCLLETCFQCQKRLAKMHFKCNHFLQSSHIINI